MTEFRCVKCAHTVKQYQEAPYKGKDACKCCYNIIHCSICAQATEYIEAGNSSSGLMCKCCSKCVNLAKNCKCKKISKPGFILSDPDDDEDDSGESFSTKTSPWDTKGLPPASPTAWATKWRPRHKEIDLVSVAANFYVLLAISDGGANNVKIPVFASMASEMLHELCMDVGPAFMDYFDLAIGGELRHHPCTKMPLSSNRKASWGRWHGVRQNYGVGAILTAAELFREFPNSSFGGKKWATAAELLYKARTGKISMEHWVHMALHVEHNGGCFFNKLAWAITNKQGWDMSQLKNRIFPAHGMNPVQWDWLLPSCNADVTSLLYDYWPQSNRERRILGWEMTLLRSETKTPSVKVLSGYKKLVAMKLAEKKAAIEAKAKLYPQYCICAKCLAQKAQEKEVEYGKEMAAQEVNWFT